MILSKNFLSSLVNEIKYLSSSQLATIFNQVGIEVEHCYSLDKIKNLKIGIIKEISKHEQDNQLNVCKVLIDGKNYQIISQSSNLEVNKKVVVALENTKMLNNEIVCEKTIKNVTSQGIFCRYNDLFLNDELISDYDQKNVILLDDKIDINSFSINSLFGIDDEIYDLSIPSNRNDLNSLIGIILEIKHLLGIDFNFITDVNKIKLNKSNIKINLCDDIDSYYLLKIDDVFYCQSNLNVKKYLMNSNCKPTNTIDDIFKINKLISNVNYLLINNEKKFKQITFKKLENSITVATSNFGNVKLLKGEILIYGDDELIAVNNLDTIKGYGINNKSSSILAICAKTNNNKNNDLNAYFYLNSLYLIINNLSPKFNKISGNYQFNLSEKKAILFDYKTINKILATNFSKTELKNILSKLGFVIKTDHILIKQSRNDIEDIQDVCEEIIKLIGIDNIPNQPVTTFDYCLTDNFLNDKISLIINYLVNNGFYHLKTYNLVSAKINDEYNFFNYQKRIKIKNFLSDIRKEYRLSLLNGVIETYKYNNSLKNENYPVFEIQNVYTLDTNYTHLIFAIPNQKFNYNMINNSYEKNDLFLAKKILNNIGCILGVEFNYSLVVDKLFSCCNDSVNVFYNQNLVGYITRINPITLKENKITVDLMYVCEINLELVINRETNQNFKINYVENKHDVVRRLSILLDKEYDLNSFYKFANKCSLLNNFKIVSAFFDNNKWSYNVEFNLVNDLSTSIDEQFENIIKYFENAGFLIKKGNNV